MATNTRVIFLMSEAEHRSPECGVIGELKEDGLPVIYALDLDSPSKSEVARFLWLLIISWKYDKHARNGMPPEHINLEMKKLETSLPDEFLKKACARWAYNRTGNSLKEFSYYVGDPGHFIEQLNVFLSGKTRYPIKNTVL